MERIAKLRIYTVFLCLIMALSIGLNFILSKYESHTYNNNHNTERLNLKKAGSWDIPPLFINGSAKGVGAHNWSWVEEQIWFGGGNGSLNNPYIIENITIDGGQLPGNCIEIVDSNKYFILRKCAPFYCASGTFDAGIKLDNVNNSKLMHNFITNNRGNGILLISSSNNYILNNEITYNDFVGVYIYYSDFNNISNNIVRENIDYGMYIGYSNHNKVVNNTIDLNGEYGLYASDCEYSLFSHNSLSNNGRYHFGDGMHISSDCSHCIFSNNFFNHNSHDGITIYGAYNLTIIHNEIIGNYINGLSVLLMHDSILFNNTIDYNNGNGIKFTLCEKNKIIENSASYNLEDGLYLTNSNNHTIQHNEVKYNDQNGIVLSGGCDMNNLTRNSINNNHLNGLYLRQSDNNSIIENNLIGNENCIYEINCIGNILINNKCNRTNEIFVEILNLIFSSEEFNITFHIYNVNNSGLTIDSILMFWNGVDVSDDVQNLENGYYFISLEPITVTPGEDPILLSMTISATGYENKYFEIDIAVDPDSLLKGEEESPEEFPLTIIIIILAVSAGVIIGLISIYRLRWRKRTTQ